MTVLIDGVNGLERNFFYKQLPFAIRGTKDWDNREKMRKKIGCCCVCLGSIPLHSAAGEKWEHKNKFKIINNRLKRTR